jgi:hypothetical protein
MFFSDELIEVGRKSNKKNNLSMGQAMLTMLDMCNERVRTAQPNEKTYMERNTANNFNLAVKTLFKEGYTYMHPERFKLIS